MKHYRRVWLASCLLTHLFTAHASHNERLDTQIYNSSSIACLPDELIVQIFQLRDVLNHTSPVCKKWEQLRHNPAVPLKVRIRDKSCLEEVCNSIYTKRYIEFDGYTPEAEALATLVAKCDPVYMDLSGTAIRDVSALGNVHTLNLWGTPVTDVSALGNVHTLDLARTKVTDVSALSNVQIIK